MVTSESLVGCYTWNLHMSVSHNDAINICFSLMERDMANKMREMSIKSPDDVSLVVDEQIQVWEAFKAKLSENSELKDYKLNILGFHELLLTRKPKFIWKWMSFRFQEKV